MDLIIWQEAQAQIIISMQKTNTIFMGHYEIHSFFSLSNWVQQIFLNLHHICKAILLALPSKSIQNSTTSFPFIAARMV